VHHIRQKSFETTSDVLRELDFAHPSNLKLMFQYKMLDREEREQVADEVEGEYRSGMQDPSREAARMERSKAVRKNVGRKKLVNDNERARQMQREILKGGRVF